jgi:hypothetical protein
MTIWLIVGVLLVSALIGLGAWRFLKTMESFHAHPARFRKLLIFLVVLYCLGMISAIDDVLQPNAPAIGLFGLPIGLGFVWMLFRAANATRSREK